MIETLHEALSLLSGQTCQMCTRWIQCEPEHDYFAIGCKAYDNPFDMNYDNPFDMNYDNPFDMNYDNPFDNPFDPFDKFEEGEK